jgi:hypothetical protein
MHRYKKPKALQLKITPGIIIRLLSKVKEVKGPLDTPCWEWRSQLCKREYGEFWAEGQKRIAHRCSFALFKGSIPKHIEVHHKCYNSKCINPFHLDLENGHVNNVEMVNRRNGLGADDETPF